MDFKALLEGIIANFKKINKKQRIILISSGVILLGFFVFLMLFEAEPKDPKDEYKGYGILFTGIDPSDSATILEHLKSKDIPYKIPDENTIMIPEENVYEERFNLASMQIPKSSKIGFEIFDIKDFGATDFDQQVKLLRATEGELTRTIESLTPIEKASIHIAIPKDSVFVSKSVPPTASIKLVIRPNMSLSPSQVLGIKNLVASAVPKLVPENVKLTNQDGELLGELDSESMTNREAAKLASIQQRHKQNVEKVLEDKIVQVLTPIVGNAKKVVAKVSSEFDFSQKKSTQELFDPNSVVRSEQNLEEKKEGLPPVEIGGVPGVVSNIGPVQGLEDNGNKEKYEKSQNTINYEVGKTISETKGEFGTLKRISAAVVVDGKYRLNTAEDGTQTMEYIALSAEQMAQIDALVRQAIGFNATRGDEVTVSNFEFDSASANFVPIDRWESISQNVEKYLSPFLPLFKYVLVAIVLLVLYKQVIYPFSQRMQESQKEEEEEVEPLSFDEIENEDEYSKFRQTYEEQLGANSINEDEVKYEVLIEKMRNLAQEKPEEVAQLFATLISDELEMNGAS